MFSLVPIGYVRSPFKDVGKAPRQGRDTGVEVAIEVAPSFVDALAGIEESTRLQIACWLHLADRDRLRVHPRGDPGNPMRGVFATRSPARPNPIAVYTVDLIEVRGNTLQVRGIDAVDGTPVVDIKPHARRLDD